MAQIPVYGGTQVRSNALQPVQQREVDVSSGLKAIGAGLGQVADVANAHVRREAETEANRIDSEVTSNWLKWDAENRRKYQGQNVDQYAAEAEKWWADAPEVYAKDTSPMARAAVGQTLARKRAQAIGSVVSHVGAEKERAADAQYGAANQTDTDWAVDTGDAVGMRAQVIKRVSEYGARKGMTTPEVEAERQRVLGQMHLTFITALTEGTDKRAPDPTAARAYFEANKGEIPGTVQPRVEQVLKAEVDNQFAKQFAAERAGKPLSEQLQDVAKIEDPGRQEKARLAVNNTNALVQAAGREREAAASDAAWQMVGKGQQVPERVLAQMNGRERVQLQEHLVARAKQLAAGTPVKTDWGVYQEVRDRIVNGEKVNMAAYGTKLAGGEMEKLIDMQSQAKGGAKQDSMLTDTQRVDAALTGLGLDKKKNAEEAGVFTAEVDRRVRAESMARGGKDLTATEKQVIVDQVALDKVYVDKWGRDPEKPVALLKPDEIANAYVNVGGKAVRVSSVPAPDRAEIIRERKARGLPVTEQSIVETYLKAQAKPRPTGKKE